MMSTACASVHKLPKRPELSGFKDPAYRMKLYYEYRLNEGKTGWYVQWSPVGADGSPPMRYLGNADLPAFFEINRDPTAAEWARDGRRMDWAGWLLGLGTEAGFIYASVNAENDAFKPMWAYGVLPSALVTWAFHAMGDKWFRRPAVSHYNRELKRELDVSED